MSIKVHYCKFCGGNLDADYRCWDVSCKFAGVVQVAKHKAKLVADAAVAAAASAASAMFVAPTASTASTPATQSQTAKHEPLPESLPEPHKIAEEAKAAIAEFRAKLNQQNASELAMAKHEKERLQREHESMEQLPSLQLLQGQGFAYWAPGYHDMIIMRFNRIVTRRELEQLHELFELMLKGYNDARQR